MPPISDLRTSQIFQDAFSRAAFRDNRKIDLIQPGEEFAPSAELEDVPVRSRRWSGQVKAPRQKSWGDDISDATLFFWCFVLILSGFYFMFWRQEKFIVGFCGVPQTERTHPYVR